MLSYESNPSDPLKSIGQSTVQRNSSDENISGDNISLPQAEHQLISSSVEVHNFSIRDFVFSVRNKDIGTNWPFPDKHLKLCLKHGVNELLPPFESKTNKRKPYSTICLEKNILVDDVIIPRFRDEEPSERVDSLTVHSLGDVCLTQKITAHHLDRLDVHFDKPDKDGCHPSSDTSNSQAFPSRAGGTFKHHRFRKTSSKTSSSNCKLIVKFGSPSVHSSNKGIMPHKTNLSDPPASKVCPVCKTFSSSSNTTLNAHIDQCLSMETTSEGMADSKTGTKCKEKPRKMRTMVEIYATALLCTIEDLDKRNGSSWATDLSWPPRNTGVNSAQGNKKQITSPAEFDRGDNDDGGVYIDANGRKLRILSKMDSFSSVVTTKDDYGSRKPQINKTLSSSKKKHRGNKHHKYLKLAVSDEKHLAPKANSSQVLRTQKPSNDSMLSKGSRDADDVDTFRYKGTNQHPRHKIHAAQRSTVKIQKSRLGKFGVEKSSFQDFYRDSACLSESHKRIKSPDGIRISTKHCLGMKRTRPAISMDDDKNYNTDTNVHKRLKKSTVKPQNQLDRFEKGINENRLSTAKSASSTKHIHRFLQKSAKLGRDNTSSISERLVHDPKMWKKTLCSTNEEDRVQIEVEEDGDVDSDDNLATWQSESHDAELEHTQNQPLAVEGRIDESEKDRRGVSHISKDGALNVDACDDIVDNLSVPLSSSKVAEHGRLEILTDPHKKFTTERIMRRFIRSMNPDDHERTDCYEYQSLPQASNDSSTGPNSASSPPEPVLNEGMCNYSMELDSKATQGNLCSDIDPIPIPGPPGSFLPSPGNAETEDYQGNSSLTASLSSSHYEQDGGHSSKSSTSSASNLAAEICEQVAEKFPSTGTHAIPAPDSSLFGFPIPSSEVSMVEASIFPQAMKFGSTRSEFGDQKSYEKPQDENQPGCCSRKERVQRGSVADYQESQLLRRRTMSATVLPTKENISCSLNTAPSYSYAGSDIYSLSSSSFRAVDVPVLKAPAGVGVASPKYPDAINASKFHSSGNSESASPSAVLRLMGKNLMVAKNDENLSVPSRNIAAPRNTSIQMLSSEAASLPKPQNIRSYCSQFQKAAPPDPARDSPSYSSNMRHTFDFRMPNGGPWGEINFPRPGITNHLQAALFDHKWQVNQCMPPNNGFDILPDHMHRGPSSLVDFRKAGSEVSPCRNGITVSSSLNYTGASSIAATEHDLSRLIHPVYPPALSSTSVYMQQVPGNTCFPIPFSSSGRSLNPLQVNNYYSQNGSYVLHGGGPFMASSSTHPTPGLFYSPKLP